MASVNIVAWSYPEELPLGVSPMGYILNAKYRSAGESNGPGNLMELTSVKPRGE